MNKILISFIISLFFLTSVSAWTSGLSNGTTDYFNMDSLVNLRNAFNPLVVATGSAEFTSTNAIIPNSFNANNANSFNITNTTDAMLNNTAGTINIWIRLGAVRSAEEPFYGVYQGSGIGWRGYVHGTLNNVSIIYVCDSGSDYWLNELPVDQWTMVTIARNTTAFTFYWNGTKHSSCKAGQVEAINRNVRIGGNPATSDIWNGMIDEVGIWNRTLNATEVAELWNSGAGDTYPAPLAAYNLTLGYNLYPYETDNQTIFLNATYQTTIADSFDVNMTYDGTEYELNNVFSGSGIVRYEQYLDVPLFTNVNKSFHFKITISNSSGTTTEYSTNYSQQIVPINLSICNGVFNVTYFNITFKNETTSQQSITATLQYEATFWLGSGLYNKTYSYSSAVENSTYPICFSNHKSLNVRSSMIFDNSYSLPRTKYWNGLQTNMTTNLTLYLLPTSEDSHTVSFQIVNVNSQPVSRVAVNVSSSLGLLEEKTTDDAGIVSFYMNKYTPYFVEAYKSGYPIVSQTITPSETQYTLTLGSVTITTNITDTFRGIAVTIKPSIDFLVNNTEYNFNLTLVSSYNVVDSFGFTLTNQSGYYLGGDSDSSNGGLVSALVNTHNQTLIVMNYYWYIDGKITNATRVWIIKNNQYEGYSLSTFFTDLKNYSTDLFGITPTGLNILIFLIIFVLTGVCTYYFQVSSKAMILAIMFFITLIFDFSRLITYGSPLPLFSASILLMLLTIITAFAEEQGYV